MRRLLQGMCWRWMVGEVWIFKNVQHLLYKCCWKPTNILRIASGLPNTKVASRTDWCLSSAKWRCASASACQMAFTFKLCWLGICKLSTILTQKRDKKFQLPYHVNHNMYKKLHFLITLFVICRRYRHIVNICRCFLISSTYKDFWFLSISLSPFFWTIKNSLIVELSTNSPFQIPFFLSRLCGGLLTPR